MATKQETRAGLVGGAVALALAAAGAILLVIADAIWFGTDHPGGPDLSALYLLGWVLLAWAAIVAAGVGVYLVRAAVVRRR